VDARELGDVADGQQGGAGDAEGGEGLDVAPVVVPHPVVPQDGQGILCHPRGAGEDLLQVVEDGRLCGAFGDHGEQVGPEDDVAPPGQVEGGGEQRVVAQL